MTDRDPLLTIVVPTIPGRESLLSRCLHSITEQATPEVQIVAVPGPGQLGDKVNAAVSSTTATYLTVVDDDDYLDGAYVASIAPLLRTGVDFVGFRVLELLDGRYDGMSSQRGDLPRFNSETKQHGPSPKSVTKVALWRQVPLLNDYFADRWWMKKMHPLIGSHAFIDRALYVYDHQPTVSAWGGRECRDVGTWPYDPQRVVWLDV